MMLELLAPAGNYEKLKSAIHFGADAVYLAGTQFGLRATADNFSPSEMQSAIAFAHAAGKKVYVTCNIYAHNADFVSLDSFIKTLQQIHADAVIVSDLGIFARIRKIAPTLPVHVSTQANTTNKYAAAAWREMGAARIVLARELSLPEIREIRDFLPDDTVLEAFAHGAMCISYSGRCLLSDYMTGRHSNSGACTQSCRWEYALYEKTRDSYYAIEEDSRGSYILNSRDMNMIAHLREMIDAGIESFKLEGRAKTTYYVGCITNAYRRALDCILHDQPVSREILSEPEKAGCRGFTTGFYLGEKDRQYYASSKPTRSYDFCALVVDRFDEGIIVEMRNRFQSGDILEVVSSGIHHNQTLRVDRMETADGQSITDALLVQQHIKIYTNLSLMPMDMLRRKV